MCGVWWGDTTSDYCVSESCPPCLAVAWPPWDRLRASQFGPTMINHDHSKPHLNKMKTFPNNSNLCLVLMFNICWPFENVLEGNFLFGKFLLLMALGMRRLSHDEHMITLQSHKLQLQVWLKDVYCTVLSHKSISTIHHISYVLYLHDSKWMVQYKSMKLSLSSQDSLLRPRPTLRLSTTNRWERMSHHHFVSPDPASSPIIQQRMGKLFQQRRKDVCKWCNEETEIVN